METSNKIKIEKNIITDCKKHINIGQNIGLSMAICAMLTLKMSLIRDEYTKDEILNMIDITIKEVNKLKTKESGD